MSGWLYCILNIYFNEYSNRSLCKLGKSKVSEFYRFNCALNGDSAFIPIIIPKEFALEHKHSFQLAYFIHVENVDEAERMMHKYFAEQKVNTNSKGSQEWFYLIPEQAKRFFDSLKQTPKISIEYFKQRVIEEKLTLENYHDKIINDLPTIYEINKGYFQSYTSFEEIMGVTFDRRR